MPRLTRHELHDLVWSKPMIHAGAELGVSGTGLKKVCLKHEIPVPPQGWWAKLAAGHRLSPPDLPQASDPRLNEVVIVGRTGAVPRLQNGPPFLPVETDLVPQSLPRSLPKWIGQVEAALKSKKPDHQGLVSLRRNTLPRVSIAQESIDRVVRFLFGFDAAITAQGWAFEPSESGLRVLVATEPVAFLIEDRLTRKAHIPTPAELAEQARRRRLAFGNQSDQPWQKYDYYASGELAFVVQGTESDGLRRRWGDTQRQRLENALPSIIRSFAEHASAQIARRDHLAAMRQRWKEEEDRRRIAADKARLDEVRLNFAMEVHGALGNIEALTRVVDHIDSLAAPDGNVLGFRDWCHEHKQAILNQIDEVELSARLQSHVFRARLPEH